MKNIATALVKAQRAFGPALKTSTNPHFRSRYADLSACVEAVIDALNSAGIALIQRNYEDSTGVTVETLFVHESGEMLECGKLHVPASKQDPQGYGSALTYARRYSLMAACGIAPEDDDGNAASKLVKNTPTKSIEKLVADDRQEILRTSANFIAQSVKAQEVSEALAEYDAITDVEEKTFLWSMLPSDVRSTLKKAKNV
jgi:hypothetical protein